jgi:muramoyltetrapeptide carboxypeptidase
MTTPPYLKPRDKVAVISTAKRNEPHEIEQGLAQLKSWGLVPVIGVNAFKKDGFLAGTDEQRMADLQLMLDDESIKAIFFTRGGYGTLRIIDAIDFTKFKQDPKWLVGYSDITVLHSHVHNFGIQSLHAVMLQGVASSTVESSKSIRKALFGESLIYEITANSNNRAIDSVIEGTVVGGNLSMLYSIIGSESDIDMTDKILFIEDIDEYLYHYDRMLVSLKRAGKFSNLKAVIVGDMIDIKDSTIPFGRTYEQITHEHFDCPVYFNFPAGHSSDNRALILGSTVTLTTIRGIVKFDFK